MLTNEATFWIPNSGLTKFLWLPELKFFRVAFQMTAVNSRKSFRDLMHRYNSGCFFFPLIKLFRMRHQIQNAESAKLKLQSDVSSVLLLYIYIYPFWMIVSWTAAWIKTRYLKVLIKTLQWICVHSKNVSPGMKSFHDLDHYPNKRQFYYYYHPCHSIFLHVISSRPT